MDFRITVDFAGGGLENRYLQAFGKPQHVDRTHDAGLGRLDRVELVMDRRSGARQVVDGIDFDKKRKGHVVADHFKIGVVQQMHDILLVARKEVVHTDHLVALFQETFAQVTAQKACAARYQDSFFHMFPFVCIPNMGLIVA